MRSTIANTDVRGSRKSRDDAELVGDARGGDTNSFAVLVRRYQALACAVAYSATGDVSVSEDIAQEAFVTAWSQLDRLDDASKFRPWLAGIVRNSARYWRRHQKRHAPRADVGLAVLESVAASDPSPHDQVAARQDLSVTKLALTKLPSRYREALVLFYALGESYTEVANSLQISEATARQRLSRARKKLTGEVGSIQGAARSCGKRAGAAAAVLLLIKSRAAMAAATAGQAKLATGLSSKGIMALGATGIGAALVCIVSLVVLLVGKGETAPTGAPSKTTRQAAETYGPGARSRPPSAATPNPATDSANPGEAVVNEEGEVEEIRGEVAIGRGKVRDKTSFPSAGNLYGVPLGDTQRTYKSDTTGPTRTKVRHGPAVVTPNSKKPLVKPTIDLRAVERDLYRD